MDQRLVSLATYNLKYMTRIQCRTCRRLGESVCGREKCAFKKRPFAPGKLDSERKHRSSVSEYGEQLRAKQKLRISYGLREKQFGNYVREAMTTRSGAVTTEVKTAPELALYRTLESRLDNIVYRMGLAHTRALARQLVSHGHITVNGRRTTIPSRICKEGDVIAVREGSKSAKPFLEKVTALEGVSSYWMKIEPAKLTGEITAKVREVEPGYDFQKVLEYYSR